MLIAQIHHSNLYRWLRISMVVEILAGNVINRCLLPLPTKLKIALDFTVHILPWASLSRTLEVSDTQVSTR